MVTCGWEAWNLNHVAPWETQRSYLNILNAMFSAKEMARFHENRTKQNIHGHDEFPMMNHILLGASMCMLPPQTSAAMVIGVITTCYEALKAK